MSLNLVFSINAVVSVLFGLAFVLAPDMLLAHYAISVGAGGAWLGRLFGAALLGYGVVAWSMRDAAPSATRDGVVLGFLVGSLVGLVISVMGQMAGLANALGWSTVVIYAFFTLAFGYHRFMAKA